MIILVLLLGLIIGSFINAAVWRIHENKPLGNERSECPKCSHKLAVRDLIPVFSWLSLKGRCRYCNQPISRQYPLVELFTAIVFLLSFLVWNFSGNLSILLFTLWLFILTALIILAIYDIKWMLLPNSIMLALLVLVLINLIILSWDNIEVLRDHLYAALIFGGSTYALHSFSKGKLIGGGDVKLLFVMGLLLGLADTLAAFLIAVYSGAAISLYLLASKKRSRKDMVPFGPFLILGTIAAFLYGDIIISWYLDTVISV